MRICLITPEYPPMQGGVGDYSSWLALALVELGYDVSVLTSLRATSGVDLPQAEVFHKVFPNIEGWTWRCWTRILSHVADFMPDVLHIQYQTAGYGMHPAINLLPLRMRLLQHRPHLAVTFHDLKVPYLFPKAGSIRRLPGYLLARSADAVVVTNPEDYNAVCGSKGTVAAATKLANPGKSKTFAIPIGSNIPCSPPAGYDRQLWRQRLGIEQDDVLLSYFGFLNQSKGIDILIDAFSHLVRTGYPVSLLMVGGSFGDSDATNVAYGEGIKQQVEKSEFRGKIHWTGFASREQVSANLLASDISVLPFNEGASLRHGSLMAAIAHNLPIIATEAEEPHFTHCAFPSLNGRMRLVSPRDSNALARAIVQLGDSRELRLELSRSIAEIAPMFEWGAIASAHSEVYRQLS